VRLYYHTVLNTMKNQDALYAMLINAGVWLQDNLGQAERTLELNDDGISEDQKEADNDLLFAKLHELLEDTFRIVSLMTWSKGPGYEALALTSTMTDDDYMFDHHDLVVVFDDELHAVQFKLAVG
jgi:hypothetical protein